MLDLSNFTTNNFIKDLNYMFYGCNNLIRIDLSNLEGEQIINIGHMFEGCENLNNIDMGKFNFSKIQKSEGIFKGIPEEGSIVCNKNFKNDLLGLIPGSWEKVA